MRISRDDDALLTELAVLAREETAAARAWEPQLGSLDAAADRAFKQLLGTLQNQLPLAAACRPTLWQRLLRALRATLFLPVLVAVGGAVLMLWLPHVSTVVDPLTGMQTRYELSVLSGGAGIRGLATNSASSRQPSDVQASPGLAVLRAGSTVRLLLRPQEQTAANPQVVLAFDDGSTVEPWQAEIERAADGPMQLLTTLPARSGRLTIQLFSSDTHTAADQQWSLAVTSPLAH